MHVHEVINKSTVTPKAAMTGLITASTAHVIQTVIEVGILPVIVLAGIVLNGLNIAVFGRQGLSDRINLCLFSLAVSDTGYITTLLTTRFYSTLGLIHPSLGQYWKVLSLKLVGVYTGCLNTSNCLTLLISLERCFLVISPLKARTLLSIRASPACNELPQAFVICPNFHPQVKRLNRLMAGLVMVIFSTCLCCCVGFCAKFTVLPIFSAKHSMTWYRPVLTQFYKQHGQPIEVLFQSFNMVVPITTFIVVIVATSVIALRMRVVLAWRQKSTSVILTCASSTDSREPSLTRMLTVVCVMYTICSTPSVLRPLVKFFEDDFQIGKRYENSLYVSATFLHTMSAFNSSFNFVIYYIMSTRFRSTLKDLVAVTRRGTRK